MARAGTLIHYRLDLLETADSTGYFAAVPRDLPAFEAGLAYLRHHPNDGFMFAHLLASVGEMSLADVSHLLDTAETTDVVPRVLFLEAATVYGHLAGIQKRFTRRAMETLAGLTPLVFLRSGLLADQWVHRSWAPLFHANMTHHRPLPPPATTGFPFPVDGVDGSDDPSSAEAHLKAIVARCPSDREGSGKSRPPREETIARALTRLTGLAIFDGGEMRHQSSLSPCALLRKWRFHHRVKNGDLNYTISSVQTSYGRGLSLDAARASCLMEVVERCSSFASVDEAGIVGTRRPHPTVYGSLTELTGGGYRLLDPNRLGLEVPYQDEPLYWMEGVQLTAAGNPAPIWVPVQSVYLFCNLDERSLFSGLGSTGLASGNSVAEARLSALYESLERDSEAVNPYHPSRCFRIYSKDKQLNTQLEEYRSYGIHMQFQDISPAFGIPCCSCFVTHRDGTVAKGGGANLDGKRAVLSALTETPYPYPGGPSSAPPSPELPWLAFEALPDFSTGIPDLDLVRVEKTLIANGFSPIYVDITRKDLDIPVVKALVPGFEMMADFDQYCRISPRLFNNYLKTNVKN